jgi:bifunctional non-homologous end joining protein LigD
VQDSTGYIDAVTADYAFGSIRPTALIGENDIEMPVLYGEHLTGDGQEVFEYAAKPSWEGIISKRADTPYRSERTEARLKIKTFQKGKFPIIGFVEDHSGVAAL